VRSDRLASRQRPGRLRRPVWGKEYCWPQVLQLEAGLLLWSQAGSPAVPDSQSAPPAQPEQPLPLDREPAQDSPMPYYGWLASECIPSRDSRPAASAMPAIRRLRSGEARRGTVGCDLALAHLPANSPGRGIVRHPALRRRARSPVASFARAPHHFRKAPPVVPAELHTCRKNDTADYSPVRIGHIARSWQSASLY
jgi:hypothetical protein